MRLISRNVVRVPTGRQRLRPCRPRPLYGGERPDGQCQSPSLLLVAVAPHARHQEHLVAHRSLEAWDASSTVRTAGEPPVRCRLRRAGADAMRPIHRLCACLMVHHDSSGHPPGDRSATPSTSQTRDQPSARAGQHQGELRVPPNSRARGRAERRARPAGTLFCGVSTAIPDGSRVAAYVQAILHQPMRPSLICASFLFLGCEKPEQQPTTETLSVAKKAEGGPSTKQVSLPATDDLAKYEGEARAQLSRFYDTISAMSVTPRVSRGDIAALGRGEQIRTNDARQCPTDGRSTGTTAIVPPLSVDCASGPDHRCVPGDKSATGPGRYPAAIWDEEPPWSSFQFRFETPHRFHYRYRWTATDGGCEFSVQAIGRGKEGYKIYERRGTVMPDRTESSDVVVRSPRPGELD